MFYAKHEELFWDLYKCKTEQEVDKLIHQRSDIFAQSNWHPLDGNDKNYGTVENQAADPVPALVEKLTNAIDAVLMRRCYEEGIDPKSVMDAPRSIEEAVHRFFPEHSNWDLRDPRSKQAESIQIFADGYARNTANASIIIYDDGEGQHPEDFDKTFLSLGRGNKNEIRFVQGVYNMGGCGAITFCGEKRFQLVASKRYDCTGKFGFTLIRKHPLTQEEEYKYKKTWYEYLMIDGVIPAFDIKEIDLGLQNRVFRTGTIIKLYSYDLEGNRYLNRDLSLSINEYLYDPVLPILIKDSEERYPEAGQKFHAQVLFGLKRRLENSKYVETRFSAEIVDREIGTVRITVYVFRVRSEEKNLKETKTTFRRQFFKNNMSVLFSLNGQVHGHYTSEFISRTLKFQLLRDYVLIHVDCTHMKAKFRDELTMPSRDRLKHSKQMKLLRRKLGDNLKSERLKDIFKQRKDRLTYDSADDDSLLKEIGKDLPFNKDLQDLIKQTFELDAEGKKKKPKPPKPKPPREPFAGKRYPSFFHIDITKRGDTPVVQIPRGDSKTVQFESDVENQYFDRADDSGEMEFAVMTYMPNDATGGNQKGTVNDISDIFSVARRSPQDGKIRVVFEPTKDLQVGDEVEIRANLMSSAEPDGARSLMFWIKITEPQSKKPPKPKSPQEENKLGLPKLTRVVQQVDAEEREALTWEQLDRQGITMDHSVIMHPLINESDELEAIYINMNSATLRKYKGKQRNPSEEQRQLADRQYISRVYYHTLFLYVISKNKKYLISQSNGDDNYDDVDLTDYLKDLFNSNYAEFLLNFETTVLMEGLG